MPLIRPITIIFKARINNSAGALYISLLFLSSCVVNNNMYLNDPCPVGKEGKQIFAGIGTGVTPVNDTFSTVNGKNSMFIWPILTLNGQIGLTSKTDIRFSLHFPISFSGVGLRLGIQHSFLTAESPFNIALGADAGFAFGSKSIQIAGISVGDPKILGSYNGDLFLPISYRFKNELKIVVTPRYGYCVFKFYNTGKFTQQIITLGFFKNRMYFEGSLIKIDNILYPQLGFAYQFPEN